MRTGEIRVGERYRLEETYGYKGEVEVLETRVPVKERYDTGKKSGVRVLFIENQGTESWNRTKAGTERIVTSREIKMTIDEWRRAQEQAEIEMAAIEARAAAAQAEANRVNELLPAKLRMDAVLGWGGEYTLRLQHRLTLEDVPALVEELRALCGRGRE